MFDDLAFSILDFTALPNWMAVVSSRACEALRAVSVLFVVSQARGNSKLRLRKAFDKEFTSGSITPPMTGKKRLAKSQTFETSFPLSHAEDMGRVRQAIVLVE